MIPSNAKFLTMQSDEIDFDFTLCDRCEKLITNQTELFLYDSTTDEVICSDCIRDFALLKENQK